MYAAWETRYLYVIIVCRRLFVVRQHLRNCPQVRTPQHAARPHQRIHGLGAQRFTLTLVPLKNAMKCKRLVQRCVPKTPRSVQVPNQKLISSGVTNLTCSKPVAVYMEIEVDASITPAAIEDLSNRMKETAASDDTLFDQAFEPKAHIQNIVSPLKYQVSIPRCQTSGEKYHHI